MSFNQLFIEDSVFAKTQIPQKVHFLRNLVFRAYHILKNLTVFCVFMPIQNKSQINMHYWNIFVAL